MFFRVMLPNAKVYSDYAPVGNCGCCDEMELIEWVNGNFAELKQKGFNPETYPKTLDMEQLTPAINKARSAGYDVQVGCGCGDGWCDARCNEPNGCVVNIVEELFQLKRIQ